MGSGSKCQLDGKTPFCWKFRAETLSLYRQTDLRRLQGATHGKQRNQHRENGHIKKYVSYFCGRYESSGKSMCSRHDISEIRLKKIVMSEIRTHAEALELNETNVLEKLKKQLSVDNARCQEDTRQEVGKLRRRIRELDDCETL